MAPTESGLFVQPIGHIESCFRHVVGTPRQGSLAPATRARIRFSAAVSPATFDGLEHFSHVWVTFLFHLNTDIKRLTDPRTTHSAKVTPPLLQQKVGVFATRSPHRPNPVGFTLACLTALDPQARCLDLAGVDLVDGTPVLDVKPYLPFYDAVPPAALRVAPWVAAGVAAQRAVRFEAPAERQLECLISQQRLYKDDLPAMRRAIEETLAVDVRSKRQVQYAHRNGNRCLQPFDEVLLEYTVRAAAAAEGAEVLEEVVVTAVRPLPAEAVRQDSPEPQPDLDPDPNPEPEPEPAAELEPESEPDPEPDPGPEPEPTAEPEAAPPLLDSEGEGFPAGLRQEAMTLTDRAP